MNVETPGGAEAPQNGVEHNDTCVKQTHGCTMSNGTPQAPNPSLRHDAHNQLTCRQHGADQQSGDRTVHHEG